MKKRFLLFALLFCLMGRALSETLPYTKVYEPETSWPMAASVCWRAGENALSAAQNEPRPAVGLVWIDDALKVYDRSGALLSASVDQYVRACAGRVIPAFYLSSASQAEALRAYLSLGTLEDCFAAADYENASFVQSVCALPHVRGILDCTALGASALGVLGDIQIRASAALCKTVLLSPDAAEGLRCLQRLGFSAWISCPNDSLSLYTACARGANGLVVDEYLPAIRAICAFQDDAPSLLRVPFVIGHRGDPSTFAENTLDAAFGALSEGADLLETDIQLSSDGEIFILHDHSPARLLGITKVEDAEELTLSQLQAQPYLWDDPEYGLIQNNRVPAALSRYGSLFGQNEKTPYRVLSLREYLEKIKDASAALAIEIKSYDPAILDGLCRLADEMALWGRFCVISFNVTILEAAQRDYPQLPLIALGFAADGDTSQLPYFGQLDLISLFQGREAAVRQLCGLLDRWNASYSPMHVLYARSVAAAARHRGVTTWLWTYDQPSAFAQDYLSGVSGLTTDYPWWSEDFPERIELTYEKTGSWPVPVGVTRNGRRILQPNAQPIPLPDAAGSGDTLYIWRCPQQLEIDGKSYGTYYLYSAPFPRPQN